VRISQQIVVIIVRKQLFYHSFQEFFAFEKSTYTAVYRSKDGIKFIFVPGDTVKLGIDFKNKKLHERLDENPVFFLFL